MNKNYRKKFQLNFEQKTLVMFTFLFIIFLISTWLGGFKLRQTISASQSTLNLDVHALVEVEKLRNIVEAQIANSRSYFLLGSTKLFDEQKKNKQDLAESLAAFEKQYALPQIPDIIKHINALEQQHDDIFEQGKTYRAKQTESKIVGQFYQAKTAPLREKINKSLDDIAVLLNAEYAKARAQAEELAQAPQSQIPKALAWFTICSTLLFSGVVFLVLRMLGERSQQMSERERLYKAAKTAVQQRDEVLSSISQDLKEPLTAILQVNDKLKTTSEPISDSVELIKVLIANIDDRIKDILDQAKSDTGNITLRIEQLPIDSVLDDAQLMLQPLAKQKDIRLDFNSVNPPVLAFMDRERVMRILSNLIGNAIKFSPHLSRVIVKVKSDQQFIYISVKDSGPGIPEKHLAGIFDHFWQDRKTSEQGPGLGLAVVKTIAEAHGGTVQVESYVGSGSTFTFSLPRRRPAKAHIGRPANSPVKYATQPQAQVAQIKFRDETSDLTIL